MFGWLEKILGRWKKSARRPARKTGRTGKPGVTAQEPNSAPAPAEDKPRLVNKPAVGNLDLAKYRSLPVAERDRELVRRLTARIEQGDFELPHLPATTMALVNLASKPGVDVGRVVQLVSSDPSLAGELLRTANSVLYATRNPARTLNEAVMRIGLRGLRSLIFTVSVKGTILRLRGLESFSAEIWRQAFSVATIARAIAPIIGEDREEAFLTGLLHDIGKIALLSVVATESRQSQMISPAMVGHLFYVHHEHAGEVLAKKWRLSDEMISVVGHHHDFASNEEYARSAALASLAHKLDLHLSLDDEEEYRSLVRCEELEYLDLPQAKRMMILGRAKEVFEQSVYEERVAA